MKDLLISLDSNILRVSYCTPDLCSGFSKELSDNLVSGSAIKDIEAFTETLVESASDLISLKSKPTGITFILGPEDVYLSFLTVEKSDVPLEEQLMSAALAKVEVPMEDLYFSYNKIAPFVYQFVGVRKELVNTYLEVSNLWGVPIRAIVPWVLLLPKTVDSSDPAIFVGASEEGQVVALSELNGIYFASKYEDKKETHELSQLVEDLSLYNRTTPIKNIFTIDPVFSISGDYQVHPLLSQESLFTEEGFQVHNFVLNVLATHPNLLETSSNLLNLLPLPEVQSSTKVLVPTTAAVLLVVALIGGFSLLSSRPSIAPVGNSDDVLSDTAISPPEMPADSEAVGDRSGETRPNGKVYTADDLVIRVENATVVNGAAGRTQELLESQGFMVESVGTAENQLEVTQVLMLEHLMDLREVVKEALGDTIPVGVVDVLEDTGEASESSEESRPYNVLIRLGKDSSI